MQWSVDITKAVYIKAIQFAARHESSVGAVVNEALKTYMEDVTLGLLAPPPVASKRVEALGERRAG